MGIAVDCSTGETTTFADPVPTLAELKAQKKAEIEAKVAAIFAAGFAPATGPISGKTLQVRDNTDRTNWLTSQAAYSTAVAGGHGAVMGANFRALDNTTTNCSYADGLNTLLAMAAWGEAVMANGWKLKDATNAAADATGVAAVDTTQGWP